MLPPLTRCRSVVTIHDCIHLRFPQYLPKRGALAYARAQMGAAARRSNRILTVSEASKRDILEFFDVPPEKVTVIYNGIDERFATPPPEDKIRAVEERYQLQGEFALYVGNVKPHKNVERLLDAFHLVRQSGLDHLKLVVIGDEISKYAALRRAVHRYNLHKYVRFLGFLPDETLAVVYRLAVGVRVPVAVRRVRPAAARGDGLRHAGRHVERLVAAGGDGRCGAARRPVQRRGDRRRDAPRADRRRAAIRSERAGARPGARVLMGTIGASAFARSTTRSRAHDARRAGARLAHRHARRRASARGDLRAASGRRPVHAGLRPRHSLADDRGSPDPHDAAELRARYSPPLSSLPAAVPDRHRAVRPRRRWIS